MRLLTILLLFLLLGSAAGAVYVMRHRYESGDADPAAVAALKARLASIPLEIGEGDYRGREFEIDMEVIRESGADCFASVAYEDAADGSYRIYIGGSVGRQETFHAPTYCMPGSGWEILEQGTTDFDAYPVPNDEPTMRRMLLQYGNSRMLVYFWFQAGDQLADHEWSVRYYRFLDLLASAHLRDRAQFSTACLEDCSFGLETRIARRPPPSVGGAGPTGQRGRLPAAGR